MAPELTRRPAPPPAPPRPPRCAGTGALVPSPPSTVAPVTMRRFATLSLLLPAALAAPLGDNIFKSEYLCVCVCAEDDAPPLVPSARVRTHTTHTHPQHTTPHTHAAPARAHAAGRGPAPCPPHRKRPRDPLAPHPSPKSPYARARLRVPTCLHHTHTYIHTYSPTPGRARACQPICEHGPWVCAHPPCAPPFLPVCVCACVSPPSGAGLHQPHLQGQHRRHGRPLGPHQPRQGGWVCAAPPPHAAVYASATPPTHIPQPTSHAHPPTCLPLHAHHITLRYLSRPSLLACAPRTPIGHFMGRRERVGPLRQTAMHYAPVLSNDRLCA
jgi:hypothetical protein